MQIEKEIRRPGRINIPAAGLESPLAAAEEKPSGRWTVHSEQKKISSAVSFHIGATPPCRAPWNKTWPVGDHEWNKVPLACQSARTETSRESRPWSLSAQTPPVGSQSQILCGGGYSFACKIRTCYWPFRKQKIVNISSYIYITCALSSFPGFPSYCSK